MIMQKITIPKLCPVCHKDTQIVTNESGIQNLICTNPNCEGKFLNKLNHFCGIKGLNIKGISLATLEKLIEWGWVENFRDILQLQNHKEEWTKKEGFGAASVNKILTSIKTATHSTELWRVIAAAGIPQIGTAAAKILAQTFKTYSAFRKAIEDDYDFTVLDSFGKVACSELLDFNYTDIDNAVFFGIDILPVQEKEEVNNTTLSNIKVCITGKLKLFKNRNELKNKIEQCGGKVVDSVTKNTNILINNDFDSSSSKNVKAKELSIPILTEEKFLEKFDL